MIQTNQDFDINVLFIKLIKKLSLKLKFLFEINFQNLSMQTTNHREIVLHHWVWLFVDVIEIWRKIRCFVTSNTNNYKKLLFDIFWLYNVNVIISIRLFIIQIENFIVKKIIHQIIDSKLIYHFDHNLLIYSKIVIFLFDNKNVILVEKSFNNESFDIDFENDISNLKKISQSIRRSIFRWILNKTLNWLSYLW